jgi:hypothetical protein
VPLLRRQPPAPAPEPVAEDPLRPGAKGRPTPKRREAEQRRKTRVAAPTNRREAYKRRREDIREERRTMRMALRSGDERNLPPRDAGPARRLARDIVDSRRNIGSVLVFVLLAAVLIGNIKSPVAQSAVFLVFIVAIVAVAVDMFALARRVKREIRERYGVKETYGVASYAVMRALQYRRWRLPPPKVRRGEKV